MGCRGAVRPFFLRAARKSQNVDPEETRWRIIRATGIAPTPLPDHLSWQYPVLRIVRKGIVTATGARTLTISQVLDYNDLLDIEQDMELRQSEMQQK